jgi:hypothetical protein
MGHIGHQPSGLDITSEMKIEDTREQVTPS